MGLRVDREQVLADRIAAQRLDRAAEPSPSEPAVTDLGVQDTPYGSARLALAANPRRSIGKMLRAESAPEPV